MRTKRVKAVVMDNEKKDRQEKENEMG